jgi:hypothetical protein
MAKQVVDIGQAPNDGTGDPIRVAMDKLNDNFNEVYRAVGGVGSQTLLNMVSNNAIQVLNTWNPISFKIDTLAELNNLSASTYHGCIAHVHETGALYYAHVNWNRLLSDANTSISAYVDPLTDMVYANNHTNTEVADYVLATNADGTYTWVEQSAGGGGSSNTFSSFAVSGQTSVVADSITDTLTLVAGSNMTITTDATNDRITFASTGGGSGGNSSPGFTPTRVSQAVTTSSLPDGFDTDISFADLGASFALYSVTVDRAARVRVYKDVASRTADASRAQGIDPAEGTGVILEYVSNSANTIVLSPAVFGFIDSGESTMPVRVTNISGSTSTVVVTLTGLKLENF